jgi:hypothetical protein
MSPPPMRLPTWFERKFQILLNFILEQLHSVHRDYPDSAIIVLSGIHLLRRNSRFESCRLFQFQSPLSSGVMTRYYAVCV